MKLIIKVKDGVRFIIWSQFVPLKAVDTIGNYSKKLSAVNLTWLCFFFHIVISQLR